MRNIIIPAREIPEQTLHIENILIIPDQMRMVVNTGDLTNTNFERVLTDEELDTVLDLIEPAVTAKFETASVVAVPVEKAPIGDVEVAPL